MMEMPDVIYMPNYYSESDETETYHHDRLL